MKVAEDIINDKGSHIESVSPTDTIAQALRIMVDKKIGSIVIMENDSVLGIWTERHLMNSMIKPDFDIERELISNHMNRKIVTVDHNELTYKISDKLLGIKTRYVFVKKNDKIIGILSAGDIIRACLIEKTQQLKSMGLEYYENWKHN